MPNRKVINLMKKPTQELLLEVCWLEYKSCKRGITNNQVKKQILAAAAIIHKSGEEPDNIELVERFTEMNYSPEMDPLK